MIRIRRSLVLYLVAWIAIRIGQLVVVVRMTILALGGSVLPRQRKLRRIVVKRGRLPGGRGVTLHADLRITLRLVIWISGTDIVGTMAVDTVHGQSSELIVDMTILAQHRLVSTGQWKLCIVM